MGNSSNKRIAKNTVFLYMRMFLMMGITLYTSRVVLRLLGAEDFGLYNVLAGFVSMFGMISGTISVAISRFITVEIGKGDFEKLKTVFSTSKIVQWLLSAIIFGAGLVIGLWFIFNKMQLPAERDNAAIFVLFFSLIAFVVNLISIPYNAVIIAHEKMSAFAYISIIEASLKLIIVYLLQLSSVDKLILYSLLLMSVQISIRLIYGIYSKRNFEECRERGSFDKQVFKELWAFTGWNIIGNGAYTLSTQGINMLINVYFGVNANAARGIANQLNGAVQQFVINFTLAMNPQITKSYAYNDKKHAYNLVCTGAKYAFFLMMMIGLPMIFEIDTILKIWLVTPPPLSSSFAVWTIITSMTVILGQTLVTLMLANGDTKKYQLTISLFSVLPFPITLLAYSIGASVIWSYIIFFVVFYIIVYVRLWLVHSLTGIPYRLYLREVIIRTHVVISLTAIPTYFVINLFDPSLIRIVFSVIFSNIILLLNVSLFGMSKNERKHIISILKFQVLKSFQRR